MKVRKNITLSKKAEEYLRMLAREKKKSQSEVIEELIEKEAKEYEKKKRLEAFERLVKNAKYYSGKIGNKTIQQIKEEMGSEL
ncbi:hypothetical protein [Aquifex aeolicus]|uniref:hypothetical protein n=1 Tax=Aquifex aeolicus TaxID=63363 RepID=UPI0002E85909|nr:hypothetical protein [Aquifex aeolicus]